jgi:hypothetical protein
MIIWYKNALVDGGYSGESFATAVKEIINATGAIT